MTPEALLRAFEPLAEAPGGVARLRELVLSLAVRGRLVSQDPGDEPASVLLTRIQAEKARLVKEGKLKKQEPLPPVSPNEMPFELPGGWEWVRLGEVCQFIDYRGFTPEKTEHGVRLLTAKNVRVGYIKEEPQEFISSETYNSWMTRGFPRVGDVLFTTEAPLGNAAELLFDEPVALAQRVIDLQPFADFRGRFLMFSLLSLPLQQLIRLQATGMTATGIKAAKLKLIPLPLPPLPEQHRIVARVDELMGLLDRLEAAQAQREAARVAHRASALAALREANSPEEVALAWQRVSEGFRTLLCTPEDMAPLRQTILQLAVRGKLVPQDAGDEPASVLLTRIQAEKARLVKEGKLSRERAMEQVPQTRPGLPRSWAWCRLGSVLSDCRNGVSAAPNDSGVGTPILRISAATSNRKGYVDLNEHKHVEIDCKTMDAFAIAKGDLLVCRFNGNLHYVGRAALVEHTPSSPIVYPDKLIRLRPILAQTDYIRYAMNSLVVREQVESMASTTAGNIGINGNHLRSWLIPLPPLAEQQRIVAKVDELMGLLDRLEAQLTQTREWQDAFAASAVQGLDG